jgi:hydrogenase maturation protease
VILLVGIGNPLRGDDSAGPLFAQSLARDLRERGLQVNVLTTQQLLPEHAVEVSSPAVDAVIFVDATHTMPGISITGVPNSAEGAALIESSAMTHHTTAETLLSYVSLLGSQPPLSFLVTIGGAVFDHGDAVSSHVSAALRRSSLTAYLLIQHMAHA